LTAESVAAFLASLVVHKGVSTTTVNHYRQILLTFCNWAMTEGGVRFPGEKNPLERVKRYRQHKSDITFLKRPEITAQLDALSADIGLQTMVAVYIFAGLRREEALWLMPGDFDWDAGAHGTIRIRDKEYNGKRWVPKTRSNRTVPISSLLRVYLDAYRAVQPAGDWFFASPTGCRWDVDNFSEHLRRANRAVGLAWSCLDYRHTFGSHLAMKGESLYKISKLMGNSPQVCEKHYAALLPESLFASVEFDADPPQRVAASPGDEAEIAAVPRLRLVVSNG
jgi:integrase